MQLCSLSDWGAGGSPRLRQGSGTGSRALRAPCPDAGLQPGVSGVPLPPGGRVGGVVEHPMDSRLPCVPRYADIPAACQFLET